MPWAALCLHCQEAADIERAENVARFIDVNHNLTLDLGEGLGDHAEQQHGFFVYDASTHIPLIVAGPGVPARVVPQQVRIVDVMPSAGPYSANGANASSRCVSLDFFRKSATCLSW